MVRKKGFVFGVLLVLASVVCVAYWGWAFGDLFVSSMVNEASDYKIFIDRDVLDVLNVEYSQDVEKLWCLEGDIDDDLREVEILSLEVVVLSDVGRDYAFSEERNICDGSLGAIHTHPKHFGFIPSCEFSATDFYSLGELGVASGHRLGGVYCSEDRIAFYFANTVDDENLFSDNFRVGFEVLDGEVSN